MIETTTQSNQPSEKLAISSVFLAYFLWGYLVLYMWLLNSVSAMEIVFHRALWAAIMLWGYALYSRKFWTVVRLFQSLENLKFLLLSTFLLTSNWSLFVYAISVGNALATSMAYFICPTMTMAIALSIYGEKLNGLQWLSMILILIGIGIKIYVEGSFPWLSLGMALSWALYSMTQRKLTIPTISRLTVETTLALPFLTVLFFYWASSTEYQMHFTIAANLTNFLLIGCGLVTIVPLLLFNFGVKQTPFKWVSVMQYIVPSMSFLTAVFIFGEALNQGTLVAFIFIWSAMIFFIAAQLRENRKKAKKIQAESAIKQ